MRPQPGIYAWEQAEIERSMDDESGATLSSPSDRYRQGTAPGGVEMARAWIGQPRAGIPEDELFITPREIFDLGISFLPVIGDAYGLYQDIDTFINDPESRTLPNYALAAVGLLPFVPSGMARFARNLGRKLDAPRAQSDELQSLGVRPARNRHGRLGDAFTREVVEFTQQQMLANNPTWQHIGGGTKGEIAFAGPGHRLGRDLNPPSKDGRARSRFPDLLFYDQDRGRYIALQIVRTDSRGLPLTEELIAARDLGRRGDDVYDVYPPKIEELNE